MATKTGTAEAFEDSGQLQPWLDSQGLVRALRNGLITAGVAVVLAIFFGSLLRPIIESASVQETVTTTLQKLLVFLIPFVVYIVSSGTLRGVAEADKRRAVITALVAAVVLFVVVTAGQYVAQRGPFGEQPSLQMTLGSVENGAVVEAVEPGGAADEAGLQVGDVITAIRRDPITRESLLSQVSGAREGDPFRLRFLRDGEELQETVRVSSEPQTDTRAIAVQFGIALVLAVVTLFWPGGWTPYVILIALLSPLLTGYIWLIIATFSYRTRGILPLNAQDQLGGLTLDNWLFLTGRDVTGFEFDIWTIALRSLGIAVVQTILILIVSSMAGYALSRMNFFGRRTFLSFTLILHGFPAITLLIPIFFVLRYIGNIPLAGDLFGFNTVGGIALVMVAFELPLGVWLMKGFFDNIPWDMERSALIDGASRWRTYWEILLPQIRPGILALGIFAFISGWNAFIIPQTYSIGAGHINLPVFLRELQGETSPVNWNQVAAVGLFQLIPIMIFFIFAQEYLLNIYAGGTKGTT